jgi:hypothetical protein
MGASRAEKEIYFEKLKELLHTYCRFYSVASAETPPNSFFKRLSSL